MEDIYQKLSIAAKLWDTTTNLPTPEIEVTETWLGKTKRHVHTEKKTIRIADLPKWLETTTRSRSQAMQAPTTDQTLVEAEPLEETMVQRVVWAKVDTELPQLHMSKDVQKTLTREFGLELAWRYSRTFFSGFIELPAGTRQRTFVFNYLPKLSCLWSHTTTDGKPPLTSAIVLIRKDQEPKMLKQFQETLLAPFPCALLYQSHFLAYTLALLLSVQNDAQQRLIQSQVGSIEKRTGHHQFQVRPEGAAAGDWSTLSANASGLATKLASVEKKRVMVESLLGDIEEECGDAADAEEEEEEEALMKEGRKLLRSQVKVLKRRHVAQGLDTKYILKRVEIQIQALFHLITSDEAQASLDMTHEMSSIAWSTYRDAASMKTLAVVTMFFLPGSFVSALFSTPLFDWDNAPNDSMNVGSMPQLDLYWAITIPLTIGVFLAYAAWLWWVRRGMKRRRSEQERVKSEKEVEREARRKKAGEALDGEGGFEMEGLGQRIGTWTNTLRGVRRRAYTTATHEA